MATEIPVWLQFIDTFTTLAVLGGIVWAFYTGRIVPSTLVDIDRRNQEQYKLLTESFHKLAEAFGRLCAVMERAYLDAPLAGMLDENGAQITAQLTKHSDALRAYKDQT